MNVRITPTKLHGAIDAIPSKSHAHRVLIAQKLAQLQGQRKTDGLVVPTFSEDIGATKNCLIQMDKEMPFLDCKESGSTLRFMLPAAMALKDEAVFIGSGKLPYRPISPLKEEMEAHGCSFQMGNKHQKVSDKYKEICTVRGRLQPGEYHLAGNVSSQFITGLLFALPLLSGDSVLKLTTSLESAGYVDLTLDVLRSFGVEIGISTSAEGFEVYEIAGGQRYVEPEGLAIEGDWSNASFWLACGALGGDITVRGLDLASSQRDKEIVEALRRMGAEVHAEERQVTVRGAAEGQVPAQDGTECQEITVRGAAENQVAVQDGAECQKVTRRGRANNPDFGSVSAGANPGGVTLKGLEVDVAQIPDMVPVLATVMALAEGTSMITHAERLKIKESDRLRTVYDFLSKLGADISYGGSGLSLTGRQMLDGGEADSHNDHRIAMAAAVASCGCTGPVVITGAEAVNKSYPGFFEDFAKLGGQVEEI